MSEFENKVAIVTGAAGGLGEEVSLALAREGIHVVMADRSENVKDSFEKVVSQNPHNKGFAVVMDVTDEENFENLVNRTVTQLGQLDIMVNNAGVVQNAVEITELSLNEFNRVMDVNFKGVFLGSKYAAKQMKLQKSGSIVNVSSFYGKQGYKYYASYCASKAAVITLTQTLALELAEHNINANSVCPGFMATEMHWDALRNEARVNNISFEETKAQVAESIPLKRHGTGTDIAGALLYLSSKAGSYVTGHALNVNGGVEVN